MNSSNHTAATRQRLPRGKGWLLREQIITKAMELTLSSGKAQVPSARQLCRAVGVTAPSIYRHFSSKDQLIDAVLAKYFDLLGAAIQKATVNLSDPAERLHALGGAYLRFAAENPPMYQLAAATSPLGNSAFRHLLIIIQELVDQDRFPPDSTLRVAMQIWATTHGITSLLVTGTFAHWGDEVSFAHRALNTAYSGYTLAGAAIFDQTSGEMPGPVSFGL